MPQAAEGENSAAPNCVKAWLWSHRKHNLASFPIGQQQYVRCGAPLRPPIVGPLLILCCDVT